MSRPLAVPILKAIKWLKPANRELRRRNYPVYHRHLLAVFPAQVALVKGDEEGAEAGAQDEGAAGKDQGDEAERPALERASGRAAAPDEGRQSTGRLSAFAHPDALSLRTLPGHYYLTWISDRPPFFGCRIFRREIRITFLEILMAGTMIVLQLITPAPSADPLQRKMMAIGMPIFMFYVLWGAPSGLLLYWLVGNIVGFSQQFVINKLTQSGDDAPPPAEPSAKGSSKKGGGTQKAAVA